MNERYFGCERCRTYTEAGYRWAYWHLEDPHVVALGEPVVAEDVLRAEGYWSPSKDDVSDGLARRILPAVKRYLTAHREHRILYLEEDMLQPGTGFWGWTDVSGA